MSDEAETACPFCGAIQDQIDVLNPISDIFVITDLGGMAVRCHTCHAAGPSGSDIGEAVRRWTIRLG